MVTASQNQDSNSNFLVQAIFVDQITEQSAQHLQTVSSKAWRQAFKTVMQEAAKRFEADAREVLPEERDHRARFGVYFYLEQKESDVQNNPSPDGSELC